MTRASKVAHIRGLTAVLSFVFMFLAAWIRSLAEKHWPDFTTFFTILFGAVLLVCGYGFFVAMCRWRVRCPKCNAGTATFTYDERDMEYLTCESCDYSEQTGYSLGD